MASEICSIRIAFPTESSEDAIKYKKKIAEVLADMPDARIDFSLMTVPKGKPKDASRPI